MTASINIQCVPTPTLFLSTNVPAPETLVTEAGDNITDESGNEITTN